jgi:prepilin-type processing-associated H-X9-DG protein
MLDRQLPMKRCENSFVRAFTLIELLVIVASLGILAAILLRALARPKRVAPGNRCVNNLKQVGLAFRTWALDNGDKYPMAVPMTNGGTMELVGSSVVFTHFQVMSNELSTPKILICPEDSNRQYASTFTTTVRSGLPNVVPFTSNTNVSYFVGVDADQTQPSMFLTGDANLALEGHQPKSGLQSFAPENQVSWYEPRHAKRGSIGMADGSVQRLDTPGLRKALKESGVTNRLAIPKFP